MTSTRWWEYVTTKIKELTYKEASQKAGFDKSAFTRWKNGAKADPEFVVKFARGFNLNVLEALVEAEFITEQEAGLKKIQVGGVVLEQASDKQILTEISRRLDSRSSQRAAADSDPAVVGIREDARALHLVPADDNDGTVVDFHSTYNAHEYAADSSVDETQQRLDRGEDFID